MWNYNRDTDIANLVDALATRESAGWLEVLARPYRQQIDYCAADKKGRALHAKALYRLVKPQVERSDRYALKKRIVDHVIPCDYDLAFPHRPQPPRPLNSLRGSSSNASAQLQDWLSSPDPEDSPTQRAVDCQPLVTQLTEDIKLLVERLEQVSASANRSPKAPQTPPQSRFCELAATPEG
jgi:hypothetical protein